MFSLKTQLFLIVVCVILLLLLLNMIKKYELQLKYAILWLFVVVVMLIISIVPQLASLLADAIGFKTPSNFVFLIGILSIFVIMFSMTLAISSMSMKLRQVSQKVGLLEYQLSHLKLKNGDCDERDEKMNTSE